MDYSSRAESAFEPGKAEEDAFATAPPASSLSFPCFESIGSSSGSPQRCLGPTPPPPPPPPPPAPPLPFAQGRVFSDQAASGLGSVSSNLFGTDEDGMSENDWDQAIFRTKAISDDEGGDERGGYGSDSEVSWMNPGSLGHPEVCRRPCIFFGSGACGNRTTCGYCHLPHNQRPVHFDKRQRDFVQKLGDAERLELISKHLRQRAQSKGFLEEATEVLELISAWSQQLGPPAAVSMASHKDLAKLECLMGRMPFSTLLRVAIRNNPDAAEANSVASDQDISFPDRITAALARMRLQLTSEYEIFSL
eukprot:gb/GFBE01011910.1/.p1 GENE.gb/GFBE01011910.1/~~gb/GFBE01011910.1/.p1  ORF type:complete len:306 (+),score=31.81 gb/GFBE01011910.1/:1-918(+)